MLMGYLLGATVTLLVGARGRVFRSPDLPLSRYLDGFRDALRSVLASPARYEAGLHAGLAASGDDEEVGRLLDDGEGRFLVLGRDRARNGVAALQLGERGRRVREDVLLDLLAAPAGLLHDDLVLAGEDHRVLRVAPGGRADPH